MLEPLLDAGLQPVQPDGGPLLEDGAAQRSGEAEDQAAETDLERSLETRTPEEETSPVETIDDDRDEDHSY